MKSFGEWLADLTKELQDNPSINTSQPENPPAGELTEDDEWEDYYQRAIRASKTRGATYARGKAYTRGCNYNGTDYYYGEDE